MEIYPDNIFYNGTIYPMDGDANIYSAMAVKDGKIISLAGKGQENTMIDRLGGRAHTLLENLNGRTVLPGFSDTHVHAPGLAFDILFNVNLYPAKSKEETLDIIKDYVNRNPDKEIYYGRGVNGSFFSPEESTTGPKKDHLDQISKSKPIIIADFGGNYLWVNSAALRKFNVGPHTPSPVENGLPLNPDDGTLWGVLKGDARALIPYQEFSSEENYMGAKWFQDKMLSYGYTSVLALRPPGAAEPRTTLFPMFKALEEKGELFMRVQGGRDMDAQGDIDGQIEEMKSLRNKYNSPLIQFTTAKFFLDGTVEGLDGYLLEPYCKASGAGENYRGVFLWDKDKLAYAFERCMDSGFQIHCHTIGDGAVRKALDALEKAKSNMTAQADVWEF